MISSMTGFGRGRAAVDGITALVELKSVNSRFCEISVRLPRTLSEKEVDIQNLIKQVIPRGRISVFVQVERTGGLENPVAVHFEAAKTYYDLLEDLRRRLNLEDTVGLDDILRFPEVLDKPESSDEDVEAIWSAVKQSLDDAIDELRAMRLREGEALLADLVGRLNDIEAELSAVNAAAPERIAAARVKMQDRLAELIGEERVDNDRLEMEIALLADRLDVNEEAVRLGSHLQLFREALESAEPIGRRLNFISQEINREINTIGSKANDSTIAHHVVRMKEELEKIREQVENVQ